MTSEKRLIRSSLVTCHSSLRKLVGAIGFEPTTSRSQTERTTRLCYAPINQSDSKGPLFCGQSRLSRASVLIRGRLVPAHIAESQSSDRADTSPAPTHYSRRNR